MRYGTSYGWEAAIPIATVVWFVLAFMHGDLVGIVSSAALAGVVLDLYYLRNTSDTNE